MKTFKQFLEEKLIVYGKGKKYGQIVFLAGGSASGKGFAISNFMNGTDFKIRDVDEWKTDFVKLAQTSKKYPELKDIDWAQPKDVLKVHTWVKEKGIKDKTLKLLLANLHQDRLPNIMFDITLKDMADIKDVVKKLKEVGYNPKNIHLTWVLTKYSLAVKNNHSRKRHVMDDVVLKTHEGAANTAYEIMTKTANGIVGTYVDGQINVILNNRENTVFYADKSGKIIKNSKGNPIIKDFKYLRMKEEGKPVKKEADIMADLKSWIHNNIPKTFNTRNLHKELVK